MSVIPTPPIKDKSEPIRAMEYSEFEIIILATINTERVEKEYRFRKKRSRFNSCNGSDSQSFKTDEDDLAEQNSIKKPLSPLVDKKTNLNPGSSVLGSYKFSRIAG